MRQNKRIAVTGGIGSGKTTVCDIIRRNGYPVFSCDTVYRELEQEKDFLDGLKKMFPTAVEDGIIRKNLLADVVFRDGEALKRLNDYSHPLIMERIFALSDRYPVAFAEVPLLFEGGYEKDFDDVLIVLRNREERIAAVCRRDGLTQEKVVARINNQFTYENIDQNAHTVIYNDGDFSVLEERVLQYLKGLSV